MKPTSAGNWMPPAAALLGWAGLFIHNLGELPGHSILSGESAYPLVATLVLVLGWSTRFRRLAAIGMLSLGVLNVLGSMSVLPLPFLPFYPEQTLSHYLFHAVYLLAQLPLIFISRAYLRSQARRERDSGTGAPISNG